MKVLFGYLSVEFRGGTKFQLDFAENFKNIQVGFLTSNSHVKYEERVRKLGQMHVIPPTKQYKDRLNALKELAREYDILYLNKTTLNPIEQRMVKSAGFKKVVYHSHSTAKDVKNPLKKAAYYMLHYMARTGIDKVADKMYACSNEAGLWLFGEKNKDKFTVVNNGIDADKFRFDPELRSKKREEMGLSDFTILHAGAFSPVKNQSYLIEAFSALCKTKPDSTLLLAGNGELMDHAKETAVRCGVSDKVRFLGQRSDMSELMQAADMFVLPSLKEGLPFSAVEAQAAGLKCIITDTASAQTKITDLLQFFDVSQPPSALAETIAKEADYERRDTYDDITNGGFNLKACAEKLENELFALCEGGGPNGTDQ